jgi:hypothetical protein
VSSENIKSLREIGEENLSKEVQGAKLGILWFWEEYKCNMQGFK